MIVEKKPCPRVYRVGRDLGLVKHGRISLDEDALAIYEAIFDSSTEMWIVCKTIQLNDRQMKEQYSFLSEEDK